MLNWHYVIPSVLARAILDLLKYWIENCSVEDKKGNITSFSRHMCAQYLLCMFQQFGSLDFWHGANACLGHQCVVGNKPHSFHCWGTLSSMDSPSPSRSAPVLGPAYYIKPFPAYHVTIPSWKLVAEDLTVSWTPFLQDSWVPPEGQGGWQRGWQQHPVPDLYLPSHSC